MNNSTKKKINNLKLKLLDSYKRTSPSKSYLEELDNNINKGIFEKENIKNNLNDKNFFLTNNLNLLKDIKTDEVIRDINSKSTAYIRKRIEPLSDNYFKETIFDNHENYLSSQDEKANDKDKFDLSIKTKNLLDKIYNEKINEKIIFLN